MDPKNTSWSNFNHHTHVLVTKVEELKTKNLPAATERMLRDRFYGEFLAAVPHDIARIARACVRKKFPADWVDISDVEAEIRLKIWEYLFERVATAEFDSKGRKLAGFNVRGFSADAASQNREGSKWAGAPKESMAGRWVKRKVTQAVIKKLSRDRGECQYCRGAGFRMANGVRKDCSCVHEGAVRRRAPETVTRTGLLPERSDDRSSIQADARCCLEMMQNDVLWQKRLKAICRTARELAIMKAIAEGLGDDRRVVTILVDRQVAPSPEDGFKMVDAFIEAATVTAGKLREKGEKDEQRLRGKGERFSRS